MPPRSSPISKYRILAVCHEPRGDNIARKSLHNALQMSPGFCKYFQSVWLIATHETPDELWKRIEASVPKQDYLLVIEMSNYYGYLPKEAWEWVESAKKAGVGR